MLSVLGVLKELFPCIWITILWNIWDVDIQECGPTLKRVVPGMCVQLFALYETEKGKEPMKVQGSKGTRYTLFSSQGPCAITLF